MAILMGGSSSTGSSLLKNILSRHSKIFAGRETSLFSKLELYDDFEKYKWRIPHRFPFGLRNHSYHMYNGIDYDHEEYRLTKPILEQFIKESINFQTFADKVFKSSLRHYNKEDWLEKTPANAFLFDQFLTNFSCSKTIHTVRNPYDTIYSMMRRGFTLVRSATTYLMNTAAGLKTMNHPENMIVQYEDLISQPDLCMKNICHFLDIEYEDHILNSSNPYDISEPEVPSWNADEFESIHSRPVDIPAVKLGDINFVLHHLRITEKAREYFNLEISSIPEICALLNYEAHPHLTNIQDIKSIKTQMFEDKWSRIRKLYPWGIRKIVELI